MFLDTIETTSMTNVTTVFGNILEYMGDMVETITSDPVLVIPVAIFLAGAVIGLAKRLIGA